MVTRRPHPTHAYLCPRGHYAEAPFELKACPLATCASPELRPIKVCAERTRSLVVSRG